MGLEPTASSMRPKRSSQLSYTPEGTVTLARGRLGSEGGRGSAAVAAHGQLRLRPARRGAVGGMYRTFCSFSTLLLLQAHEQGDVGDEERRRRRGGASRPRPPRATASTKVTATAPRRVTNTSRRRRRVSARRMAACDGAGRRAEAGGRRAGRRWSGGRSAGPRSGRRRGGTGCSSESPGVVRSSTWSCWRKEAIESPGRLSRRFCR